MDGVWITGIVVASIMGVAGIVNTIVNGVVKTKQSQHQLEREYLEQMMTELQEIKARLNQMEARENFHA